MIACRRIKAAIPLLGVAFAATAGTAAADPVFSFSSQLSSPEGVMTFMGSNGNPIVTGRTVPVGITGAAEILTFGVVAKPGNLGSLSGVSALAPGAFISGSLNAISDLALDNIKIIDPGVAAGTPVSYTINFEVRGALAVAAFGTSNALAGVQLTYDFAPGSGLTLGDDVASTNPGNSGASGIFASGVADVRAHTPIQAGFVDHDVFAEFTLATHASVEAGPSLTEKGKLRRVRTSWIRSRSRAMVRSSTSSMRMAIPWRASPWTPVTAASSTIASSAAAAAGRPPPSPPLGR